MNIVQIRRVDQREKLVQLNVADQSLFWSLRRRVVALHIHLFAKAAAFSQGTDNQKQQRTFLNCFLFFDEAGVVDSTLVVEIVDSAKSVIQSNQWELIQQIEHSQLSYTRAIHDCGNNF